MRITTDTTLKVLLDEYPALTDYLIAYHPTFGKLRNPVLRNTVLRVASVGDAARMADVDSQRLADDLNAEVERLSGLGEGSAGPVASEAGAPAAEGVSTARAESTPADRQEQLKSIIRELHDGASVADVKEAFDELVKDVDSAEIAAMEQAIIAEGVPVDDVMRLCDVHVSVFKEALDAAAPTETPPGHPVHTYRLENARLGELTARLRSAIEAAGEKPGALGAVLDALEPVMALDVHYTRKENQLFPHLEAHGITGPTQVMWGLHDDIRARLKSARAALQAGDEGALASLGETVGMIDDMVYKEEHILFPVALETLAEAEWAEMAAGEAEIGFAWINGPEAEYAPPAAKTISAADIHAAEVGGLTGTVGAAGAAAAGVTRGAGMAGAAAVGAPSADLPLTTGRLTLAQLDLMLRALPVDVTFVDADDRVRYYSEGHRVFPRSPAIIGRAVTNCHPPASVDKVVQILDAFRAGEKDVAEFWITMGGRFLSIRYFALRSAEGTYEGCLEVTQDLTDLRALEGERRLLDW